MTIRKLLLVVIAGALLAVGAALAYRQFFLVRPLLELVRNELNDPEAAQFRNLRLFSNWTPRESVLCGEVNAKNRMGGYVGFRHFESGAGVASIEEPVISELYASGRLKRCNYADLAPWWGTPF